MVFVGVLVARGVGLVTRVSDSAQLEEQPGLLFTVLRFRMELQTSYQQSELAKSLSRAWYALSQICLCCRVILGLDFLCLGAILLAKKLEPTASELPEDSVVWKFSVVISGPVLLALAFFCQNGLEMPGIDSDYSFYEIALWFLFIWHFALPLVKTAKIVETAIVSVILFFSQLWLLLAILFWSEVITGRPSITF